MTEHEPRGDEAPRLPTHWDDDRSTIRHLRLQLTAVCSDLRIMEMVTNKFLGADIFADAGVSESFWVSTNWQHILTAAQNHNRDIAICLKMLEFLENRKEIYTYEQVLAVLMTLEGFDPEQYDEATLQRIYELANFTKI